MFQEGLFQYITAQASITALLGTPAPRSDKNAGMFAMLATSEAVLPYLVFQRISGAYALAYEGTNQWMNSRWRLTCYGSNQKNATLLSQAIKSLFKSGVASFPDGTAVENISLDLEADDTESFPHVTIFAVHLDYTFAYIDSIL